MAQTREQRHQNCLQSLDRYFSQKMSHETIKKLLLAQYEATSSKAFALMLMIRLNERAAYMRRDTPFSPHQDYLTLVRDILPELDRMMKGKEQQKLRDVYTIFMENPLSIFAFKKIAPYLEQYAKEKGMYGSEVASHLHFNDNDFRMLDLLVDMEKVSSPGKVNLVHFMQWATIQKIGSTRNSQATIEMAVAALIKPNLEYITNILADISPPQECKQERYDLLVGDMDCQDCYDFSSDSIYTLVEISDEFADLLFKAFSNREDLYTVKKRKFHWKLFFYGKNSPWGTLDNSLGITTPDIRLDPEEH